MSITILGVVTISPPTLPNGTVGILYLQTVTASGGIAPYIYSVSVGSLPTGLLLDAVTGVITGIPTTEAVYNFTIQAVDSLGTTGTQAYD